MSCTVVTAYYELPYKKHSSSSYDKWSRLFLENIDCNMVVFTDETSIERLKEQRKMHLDKTKFIILPLETFYTYRFMDYWKKDHERDHEKGYHHPYLYMVWAEKSMFVKRAIEYNYFDSEFYCWADIGMIRKETDIPYINKFPNSAILATLEKDKMYLLNVEDFKEHELENKTISEQFRYITARIGGTLIMGHKDIFPTWINIYYNTLHQYMENNLFAGKDQSIMATIYVILRESLIKLVKPIDSPIDPWFYLLYYFGNK